MFRTIRTLLYPVRSSAHLGLGTASHTRHPVVNRKKVQISHLELVQVCHSHLSVPFSVPNGRVAITGLRNISWTREASLSFGHRQQGLVGLGLSGDRLPVVEHGDKGNAGPCLRLVGVVRASRMTGCVQGHDPA